MRTFIPVLALLALLGVSCPPLTGPTTPPPAPQPTPPPAPTEDDSLSDEALERELLEEEARIEQELLQMEAELDRQTSTEGADLVKEEAPTPPATPPMPQPQPAPTPAPAPQPAPTPAPAPAPQPTPAPPPPPTPVTFGGTVLAGSNAPLIDWNRADYDKAKQSGRLVVLYFYADWCPICRDEVQNALYPAFNELTRNDVVGFRVNYNDSYTEPAEDDLAREFGVAYQHTKVFLQGNTRVLKSLEKWDKARYHAEIRSYAD